MVSLFDAITEQAHYRIGYLVDGWTMEFECDVGSPTEAMMVTQNLLGNILDVTYVERA